jgi:hypothetical protein
MLGIIQVASEHFNESMGAHQHLALAMGREGENMIATRPILVLTGVLALFSSAAQAAIVTIWEDQFTSVDADWTNNGTGVTFLSQAYGGAGATDGIEARVSPPGTGTYYDSITLPPAVVAAIQVGDVLEISARNSYPTGATTYLELVNTGGGSAALIPFLYYDDNGNGSGYVTKAATITTLPRATNNLYLGTRDNDGSDGIGFYGVDYIRITGDRVVPEPACGLVFASLCLGLIRRHHR